MGKEREGLFYLGQFGGHDFYRADQFGENTVERYQAYMALLQQYDKLGLRKEDMFAFVNACIQLSNENKHKDLHTYLHQLNAFLQLEYSNDMVFELTNCFLLIDDEPMTKMSLKHSDLKRKLYKENSEVQLFFLRMLQYFSEQAGILRKRLQDLGIYKGADSVDNRISIFQRNKQGKFVTNPRIIIDEIIKQDAFTIYNVSKNANMTIDQVKIMSVDSFFTLILGFEMERAAMDKKPKR